MLFMLILPTLVGVKDQFVSIGYGFKGPGEHDCYHIQYRSVRDGIADQITIVQIENVRKVELLAKQTKFCYIDNPLLVRLFCTEISV